MKFKVGDKVTPLVDDSNWVAPNEPCVIIGINTTSICIETMRDLWIIINLTNWS
ncbi:hypothetical protein M2263_002362 [Providencia alcalifaciens]|nr:hypothetical protein [Providencia alcalifaciens]